MGCCTVGIEIVVHHAGVLVRTCNFVNNKAALAIVVSCIQPQSCYLNKYLRSFLQDEALISGCKKVLNDCIGNSAIDMVRSCSAGEISRALFAGYGTPRIECTLFVPKKAGVFLSLLKGLISEM